jgi:6,7-dimethyl-8-ribityllumazine synthase
MVKIITKKNNTLNFRVAFIAAQWHAELVGVATDSCSSELTSLGVDVEKNVTVFTVPGSLEIPLLAKLIVQKGGWDAVIAFGLVVDGGIYRHEFVAQAVLNGMMNVSLETKVPILSTVLTPQKFDENNAEDIAFFRKHLIIKGAEAARSAVQIMQLASHLHDTEN